MICPILKDPVVRENFEELTNVVGKSVAYDIWNQNLGNNIDLAPNGVESKLFNTILEKTGSIREKAIKVKSRMYSKTFKRWYGIDWTNMLDLKNDRILFAYPNLNVEQYVDNSNGKAVSWDIYIKDKLDQLIKERLDPDGTMNADEFLAKKDKYKKSYKDNDALFAFLTQEWESFIESAIKNDNIVVVQDQTVMDMFSDDIDKVISTDKETFLSRQQESGINLEDSQSNYLKLHELTLSKFDTSKITSTSLEMELFMHFSENPNLVLDENGEPLTQYENDSFVGNLLEPMAQIQSTYFLPSVDDIDNEIKNFAERQGDIDLILRLLVELIESTTKSRIKALETRKIKSKDQIIANLLQQLNSIKNREISDLSNVLYTIYDINRTMSAPINKILNAQKRLRNKQDIGITNEHLVQFLLDYFGMYNAIINEISNKLFASDLYVDFLGKNNYTELKNSVTNIKENFDAALQALSEITTALATKTLVQHGLKVGNYSINLFVRERLESTDGDVSTLMKYIGSADKMNDQAVRAVAKMVVDSDAATQFDTYKKGNVILRLLEKVGMQEPLKLFEYDSDGKKTGYFVREKKMGQFLNNLKSKKKELRDKYHVRNDREYPDSLEDRKKFNEELNDWLADNCERRYTKEYYNLFNGLSEETRDARDAILFKIYKLFDDIRDESGKVHLEMLTTELWNQYTSYQLLKRMLNTKYLEDGTPKDELGLRIAEELSDLNKKLSEGLEYVINKEAFDEAKKNAKENLTPELFKQWLLRYTRIKIADSFYELLKEIDRRNYGKDYEKLLEIYNDLVSPYRDERDGKIDTKNMSRQLLRLLASLESEMARIRFNAPKKRKGSSKEGIKFEDIAERVLTPAYRRDREIASKKGESVLEAWEANTHVMRNGELVPRSYYYAVVPKDKNLIEVVPTREFSEISEKSKYYNNKFNSKVNEYYQPNSKYDNKQYDAIFGIHRDADKNIIKTDNENLWNLYEYLTNTMHESNEDIPFLTRNDKYRLPLMSGSAYLYTKNDGILKGILNRIKEDYVLNEETEGFVSNPTTRPDGSPLRMIPTYYINELQQGPQYISNNIAGMVIAYYKMARNFKHKNDILSDVEVINYLIKNRIYSGSNAAKDAKGTKTAQFLSKFIDMNLYGESMTSYIQELKSGKKVNWTKVLNSVRKYGTLLGLALNITVAAVGGITAFINQGRFAAEGRFYNEFSMGKAYVTMGKNLLACCKSMYSNVTNNKYVECMKMFNIGTEYENYYKGANRITALETVSRNWAFGAYSFTDFVIKGTLLNSIMLNYRYYNGQFYTKEQFKNIVSAENVEIWKTLSSSYDLMEMKDGYLVFKPHEKYTDKQVEEAFDKVKHNISSTASTIAATVDGLLTMTLKALLASNGFGAFIFMFRNYLPNLILERITMKKQFDYNTQTVREALYRAVGRLGALLLKDALNRKHMINWYKSLDSSDRGNIKALGYEMSMLTILNAIAIPLIRGMADNDDNWWVLFLALLTVKSAGELTNMYNPLDALRTVSSVSSMINIINPATLIINWNDISSMATGDDTTIKYGAYQGMTRSQRSLLKLIPGARSIIELQDPKLKRKYYEQMYDK